MTIEKLDLRSPDLVNANIEKIAALFPNCITETAEGKAVDFDLLRQELSNTIVQGTQERYRLEWPGKKEALLTANLPTGNTLRPVREDSVNFDTTENLYIEGDNLEVLKLLQESYLGKVKMIYIDPPYNTGSDFVYRDNFTQDTAEYLEASAQRDENRNRLVPNPDTSGRYHSDWLSMMYPRLKLARNLLADDGVIFISIDDHEVHNLRKLCDEIFGEGNFEGHIHWRRRHNQPNDKTKLIGLVAEHIIVYAKSSAYLKIRGVGKLPLTGSFSNPDNDPRGAWATKPWKVGSDQNGSRYIIQTPTGRIYDEEWMGDKATFNSLMNDNRIVFTNGGDGLPRKKYFKIEREEEGQCATNWWTHEIFGHNQEGNEELTELFDGCKNLFSNPKNTKLLNSIVQLSNAKNHDIILDFFAGSSSIAHAVMQLNAEDGGKRKFICVQLPEATAEASEAYKANYTNICEIGKERIRRAGKKIKEETKAEIDYGFRVYRLDTSNMVDVKQTPQELTQAALGLVGSNVKPDRTADDLLAQVMLAWGLPLSLPIAEADVAGKRVLKVAGNTLYACFEEGVGEDFAKAIAAEKPLRIVFRDDGFRDDTAKINVRQLLKQLSPDTEMKVI